MNLSSENSALSPTHVAGHYRWQPFAVYSLAIVLTFATFLLRQALAVSFDGRPLMILFMFPIIFSALMGGFGPGLLATFVASVCTQYFILPPVGSFAFETRHDLIQWSMLIINGLLVSLMSESLHRSRSRETFRLKEVTVIRSELDQTELLFQNTFELAAVGIVLVTPDSRWLRVNRKFCEIVGYNREELSNLTVKDITFPDDLQNDMDHLKKLLIGDNKNYKLEKRYRRKDGSLVWISLTSALVRNPDETPAYFISVIEDIQERKEMEQHLKKSQDQLMTFIQHAPIAIAMFDHDMNYLVTSGRWLQDWGLGYADLTGRNHYQMYPDIPDYWKQIHQQGLAGETLKNDNDLWLHADGSKHWLRWAVQPWTNGDGAIGGIIISCEDITGRMKAEEEIRLLNSVLEQRVTERTTELTAANRELDSFAYAVSHDLRAPLRAMSGFSHALIEDYGDLLQGEARNYLDQIGIASQKMGELIDGLLVLSRSTRSKLQNDEVDLSVLSKRLLAEMALIEPERKVDFHVEPGLIAYGDALMIELMMRNLLSNAWKYTAQTAAASIRVYSQIQDGVFKFCVADNGAGFDMAHSNRLFQPFQRLHRQDEFSGIGIGLATVQRIVHRHGGTIEAEGEPGKGAVFCFTLSNKLPDSLPGDHETT